MQRRAPGTLFVKPGKSMHDHLDLGPHALLDVIGREFQDRRFTIGQCAAHLPHPAGVESHARGDPDGRSIRFDRPGRHTQGPRLPARATRMGAGASPA